MIDRRAMLASGLGSVAVGGWAEARPRAPAWPRRDLEGLWSLASYTDLERPKELPRLVLTPAEAEAYEAPRRALHGMAASKPGQVGQAESEFNDRGSGLARVKGEIRASWITDPPDGRIPYDMAALARLRVALSAPDERLEDPEDLNGPERCLASISGGAPMAGAPDANLFQVVQTRDHVVILVEKYHDARIVRLSDRSRPKPLPPSWLGDSVGWWEGATLVVETVGGHAGVTNRGAHLVTSGATRVTERFTRSGPDELFYQFHVEDPGLYTRPWGGEMALSRATGRMFEYACHEGNYSLPGVLAGARRGERDRIAN